MRNVMHSGNVVYSYFEEKESCEWFKMIRDNKATDKLMCFTNLKVISNLTIVPSTSGIFRT